MTPESQRILEVFRNRGIQAGGMIHPADFGDAIVWNQGAVRDEPIRLALVYLFAEGYLVEHAAAFELTGKGEAQIYGDTAVPKHGARVYRVGAKLLVKQTVHRGTPPEYVIDEHRERHVRGDDDAAIASAIRDAVNGEL